LKYHTPIASPKEISAVGQVVGGRFRILELLGEGGIGQVYLAEHTELNTPFAVKVLRRELANDAEILERFKREALAASRVQHRNIIYITDFGKLKDGRLYMVMEHLEGISLQDLVNQEGPLEMPLALDILSQVADAMCCAHHHAVIHRDLKPDNIMLVKGPGRPHHVKIIDFGLAKVLDESMTKLTADGAIFGTPMHMSPEQTQGKPVDSRSDVYSYGTTAYEALTKSAPFEGNDIYTVLLAHRTTVPDPPSTRVPDSGIFPELDALVMRCLRKQPVDRYQSFDDVLVDLRACEQILLRTTGPERVSAVDQVAWEDEWSELPTRLRVDPTGAIVDPAAEDFTMEPTQPEGRYGKRRTPVSAVVPAGRPGEQFDTPVADYSEWSQEDTEASDGSVAWTDRLKDTSPQALTDSKVRIGAPDSHDSGPAHWWLDRRIIRLLRDLADGLRDQRLAPPDMLDVRVGILNLEEQAVQVATQVALEKDRLGDLQDSYRARAARLRRAVVELNLERARVKEAAAEDPSQESHLKEISYQITELDRRLYGLELEERSELESCEQNLAESQEGMDRLETDLVEAYKRLHALVQNARSQVENSILKERYEILDKLAPDAGEQVTGEVDKSEDKK
jgi:serine/threonine-protein kinase